MKVVHASGKRKRAIARASLKQGGNGTVTVNNKHLEFLEPKMYRLRMMEPLILSGDVGQGVNIKVNVMGGGVASQADATRLAIGRALVKLQPALKQVFLEYDRQILVADVRRKESAKPNSHGQARAKRQKSYR